MAKRIVPTIQCDVCEKEVRQDKASGVWLHIPSTFAFATKATKRPVAVDLCSATCGKKWIAAHPVFAGAPTEPKPKTAPKKAKKQEAVDTTPEPPVTQQEA